VAATDTQDGNATATKTAAITVNDTSVPSEVVPSTLSGSENAAISLGGVSVSVSPNVGDPLSTVLSVSRGTITAGGQTGASVTLSGTATAINTALSTASYTGNSNYYGPDTLSVTTTDTQDGNATATKTAAITVNDTSVPAESVGGPYSGNENATIPLSAITVSASPNTSDPLSMVLSVLHGTIAVNTNGGGATVTGNNSGGVTLSGTAAQINAATESYTGSDDYYGPDTLSVTTTDTADSNKTAAKTAAITVNPILPIAGNGQLDIAPGQSVDLTSALLALDAPGLPGDTLALTAVGTTGTKGTVTLSNTGDLSYKAPATGTSDSFTYTVTDETLNTSATATVNVTLSQTLAGNGSVTLTGSGNIVAGGNDNGNVNVSGAGNNNNTVVLGGGNDSVTLNGNGNSVMLGGGNDTLSLTGNGYTVTVGNGSDNVTVSGSGEVITAGTGNDGFTLGASMTSLTMHGLHDAVSVNGGTETLVDTPDGTDKMQLQIGAQGGTVSITNFGVANAVVSLVQALASAEHWTTPTQIAAAVTSDGHGDSLLGLGSYGKIDFVGVPTGQLTAHNFQIS